MSEDLIATTKNIASRMPLYREVEQQKACLLKCADELAKLLAERDTLRAELEGERQAWAMAQRHLGDRADELRKIERQYAEIRAERDLLRKSIERMMSAAGNPNAIRGCQLIVKLGKEALAGGKDE